MVFGFQQLRIRTRLYLGFGVLVAIAASVAVFGADRLSRVDAQVAALNRVSGNASHIQDVTLRLEKVRRAVARYVTTSEDAAQGDVRTAIAEAIGQLQQAAATADGADRQRQYGGLQDQIRAYEKMFDRLVSFQSRVADDRRTFYGQGDALTAATNRLVEATREDPDKTVHDAGAALEKAILLTRIAVLRFLTNENPDAPAVFIARRDEARAAIAHYDQVATGEAHALIDPVRASFDGYAAHFDSLATGVQAVSTLFENDMRPLLTRLQQEMTDVKTALGTVVSNTTNETNALSDAASRLQIAFSAMTALVGIGLSVIISRGIVNPITGMTTTMNQLARGDTTVVVPARDGRDEMGDMARAVEVFKDNMIQANRLAAEQQAEHARKEARQRVIEGHIQEFDRSIRALLATLASAAAQLRATAESMSATADQTNQQASAVSIAAGQASANVQTMAAATEEMAASAAEIARQVTRSTAIAAHAVEAARSTDQQVQGLAESAQKIEAVVAIINGIASQTNLLALNATIEAARAGDAGKGFAVVASEVKALASQTARATEEIGGQIQAIQSATRAAVEAIQGIGATINEINDISVAIAAAMEEQGATTSDMTRNTQQAALGTQEVSTTIGGVSQGAGATGAAASQVLSAATELGVKADTLRAEVDSFLGKIRAA